MFSKMPAGRGVKMLFLIRLHHMSHAKYPYCGCHVVTVAKWEHSTSNAAAAESVTTHNNFTFVSESKMPAGRVVKALSPKYLPQNHSQGQNQTTKLQRQVEQVHNVQVLNFVSESKMPAGSDVKPFTPKSLSQNHSHSAHYHQHQTKQSHRQVRNVHPRQARRRTCGQ